MGENTEVVVARIEERVIAIHERLKIIDDHLTNQNLDIAKNTIDIAGLSGKFKNIESRQSRAEKIMWTMIGITTTLMLGIIGVVLKHMGVG